MNKGTFTTKGGIVLPIVPVSEVELVPVYRRLKLPEPPVEKLPNGQDFVNKAHPDYIKAMEKATTDQGMYVLAVIAEFGVDLDLTDEQLAQVARYRKKREKTSPGAPENDFDTYLYLLQLGLDINDLTALTAAIQALNTPTHEQVQKHLDTFRPDVSRHTDNGHQDSEIWDSLSIGQA